MDKLKEETLRKNIFFVWCLSVLIGVSLFVKLSGSAIVETFFAKGQLGFLNAVCDVSSTQSLDFYQGRLEEVLWGPVFEFCTGLAFLLFAFRYLKNSKIFYFFIAVFTFLFVRKLEIILWPPYGDSASGPFMEALWLFKNHFDYVGLLHQPNFIQGGPRVYMYSIYPSFIALLWQLIPNIKLFLLVNHLFVFAFSALTITFLRKILLKFYDEPTALLASLAVFFLPLFQSQAEQLNMEMPMTMFAVMAGYFLVAKNMGWACLYGILAALVKGVGLNVSLTVFVMGCYFYCFDKEFKGRLNILLWTVLTLGLTYAVYHFNNSIIKEEGASSMVGIWEGWKEMHRLAAPYLFIASSVLFIVSFFWQRKYRSQELNKFFLALSLFMAAGAWFVVFLHSSGQMCRYRLLLAPFLLFSIFFVSEGVLKRLKWVNAFLVGFILLSLVNSYGLFFKPYPFSMHSVLERTLEYRTDFKLQMKLAKTIEEKFSDRLIVAQFTIAQILAFPELGFVHKKMDVMIYEFPCTYGIKVYNGVKDIDLRKTVFVGYKMDLPASLSFMKGYPVSVNDKILEVLERGDKQVTLFVGGEYIYKRWFLIHKHIAMQLSQGHNP